jgi:Secretion system C-terminal sorting domain
MNKQLIKLILFINLLVAFCLFTNAQTQIIINEFSQGPSGTSGDWIELVVTADSTDIRGVYYDDDNTPAHFIGREYSVRLKDTSAFASVNKGARILIYRERNAGDGLPPDDTDFSDSTLVIAQSNTDFLTMTNGLKLIGGFPDEFGIFSDNGDTSIVVGIHGISYGLDQGNASLYSSGWGYTVIDQVGAGQSAHYTEGTPGGVDVRPVRNGDLFSDGPTQTNVALNWAIVPFDSATPGELNGGNNNALPVELVSFSAILKENAIQLDWLTATEVNNYGFDVERKSGDQNWSTLGFVEGNGNSNSPKEYSFIDNNVSSSGKYYYRLKQIDNDGSYEYSQIIQVDFSSPKSFELRQNYPNPFNPSTTITFTLPVNENVSLSIYNMLGEEIKVLQNGFLEAGTYSYNFIADGLASGFYIYKLSSKNKIQTKKMLLLK